VNEPVNQRHHDAGPEARRRIKPEQVSAAAVMLAMALGGTGVFQGQSASSKIDAQTLEARAREDVRDKKREAANEKLEVILRGMAAIQAHGDSSDKASERVVAELSRVSIELRELDKTAERVSTRLDEHERRISVLEGRAK